MNQKTKLSAPAGITRSARLFLSQEAQWARDSANQAVTSAESDVWHNQARDFSGSTKTCFSWIDSRSTAAGPAFGREIKARAHRGQVWTEGPQMGPHLANQCWLPLWFFTTKPKETDKVTQERRQRQGLRVETPQLNGRGHLSRQTSVLSRILGFLAQVQPHVDRGAPTKR